jgi:TatD DNase family protein
LFFSEKKNIIRKWDMYPFPFLRYPVFCLFFRPSGMHCWDIHTHHEGQLYSIFQAGGAKIEAGIPISVGIHPWEVAPNWEAAFEKIKLDAAQNPCVLAIGEAGFDRLKGPEIPLQKAAFYAQASLAAQLEIPLILHCVKAHDLLMEYLKSTKNSPAVLWHGWNQTPELARQLLSFPVFFSFGKQLLQPNSNAAHWLSACPADRVFFETDDSALEIAAIYQAASLILQLPEVVLAERVIANWNAISKRMIS